MAFRINDIYAFLAVDDDGDEGIPAFKSGDSWFPLVAADPERLVIITDIAMSMRAQGTVLRLVKFTERIELGDVDG